MRLFNEIKRRLGDVEMIAEDLGEMDAGVLRLRERTGFPGMKILQFAFDGNDDNPYLPRNIEENSVVYTGTHDNDTTLGLLKEMSEAEFASFKKLLRAELHGKGIELPFASREEASLALMICALSTDARIAVIPVQDLMTLDGASRMNVPSVPQGNWQYRMSAFPSRRDWAVLKKNRLKKFNR